MIVLSVDSKLLLVMCGDFALLRHDRHHPQRCRVASVCRPPKEQRLARASNKAKPRIVAMGNKLGSGLRLTPIGKKTNIPIENLTPTDLYPKTTWDLKIIRQLIIEKRLAPIFVGQDSKPDVKPEEDTYEECPICFLVNCHLIL